MEEIDAEKAKVIYAWGDAPQWRTEKDYRRFAATVTPGESGEIENLGETPLLYG